jgi:hypothetical protein
VDSNWQSQSRESPIVPLRQSNRHWKRACPLLYCKGHISGLKEVMSGTDMAVDRVESLPFSSKDLLKIRVHNGKLIKLTLYSFRVWDQGSLLHKRVPWICAVGEWLLIPGADSGDGPEGSDLPPCSLPDIYCFNQNVLKYYNSRTGSWSGVLPIFLPLLPSIFWNV